MVHYGFTDEEHDFINYDIKYRMRAMPLRISSRLQKAHSKPPPGGGSMDEEQRHAAHIDDYLRAYHTPDEWMWVPTDMVLVVLFDACRMYGIADDVEMQQGLFSLYDYAVQHTDYEERANVLSDVCDLVETRRTHARVLLPFIYHEPDLTLVSSAALSYMHGFTLDSPIQVDGMFAARMLWKAVSSSGNTHAAMGVAQAVYLLGTEDARPLLDRVWSQLEGSEFDIVLGANSGRIHKARVDFLLDKLEELGDVCDSVLFGSVAGALARTGRQASRDGVFEIERQMPAFIVPGLPPEQQQGVRVLRSWTITEYRRMIASRLRAIAAHEPEPKVMHIVAEIWGISL